MEHIIISDGTINKHTLKTLAMDEDEVYDILKKKNIQKNEVYLMLIDDSKGTNVDATIKAIACMKAETILLLGGKDKGYDYTKLFQNLSKSKVVHTVIYGENKYSLLKCARSCGYERVTMCDGMEFAVKVATLKAKSGQTVLLSPASASFDEFASYEERGDKFVEIVNSFIKETDIEEDKGEIEFEEIESDESSEQIGTDASDERGRLFLEDYE
jgi:hypothetical protein